MKNKVNFTGDTSKGIKIMKFKTLALTILVSISVLASTATAAVTFNGGKNNGVSSNQLSLNGRLLQGYNVNSATQGLDFSTIAQQALKK